MVAEMASWKSIGTYVNAFSPSRANIVDGMWIFRGVDYFQTFSPTPKMTTLRVLLHVAAQCDYDLHSLEFSTDFLQGSLHEEIWLRRPPGFTGTTLAALGFTTSTADPSLYLHTNTSLPPFYIVVYITQDRLRRTITQTQSHMVHEVLQHFSFQFSLPQPTPLSTGHSLSAPPSNESVELIGPYPELVGCLITSSMGLVLGGQGPVVLTGHADASWIDDSATRQSSSCEVEIYARVMAAQELRWLTYLLTDLGEQPRSPPVLYVDNKAMIALCQEHRLVHRTKHIALRYFVALELQQRGQLRLAYMATRANTANIFTKALPPGDHQRFSTVLGLLALFFLTAGVGVVSVTGVGVDEELAIGAGAVVVASASADVAAAAANVVAAAVVC
ncbi:unnamed protein product [Closterium sp. NIES-53]